jgi:signal transduction histidine kinase/CheY-like chemotaxis protein
MTADLNARVLVFAPIGRDGQASAELLCSAGFDAEICTSLSQVIALIKAGAAVIFIAEEGLFGQDVSTLAAWVEHQPPWSDLPFVMLTSRHNQPAVARWRRRIVGLLRNVSLLERPVQAITLASAIQAGMRARLRQYEVRTLLEAQAQSGQKLEALVGVRTSELEQANNELRLEMAERAHVEESLRQSQKIEAMGQLIGGVAHDFNNLLTIILGGLDLIQRKADPTIHKVMMDGMRQAAQRGAGLTRQLLAFSRRQSLKPEPVDLERLVGAMGELLNRSLRGNLRVRRDFAADLWPVEVDPGELELAVLNLAVNARDAMPEGGTIVIRAENVASLQEADIRGDFVCLSVIDVGTGMAPDLKDRVFEPYFTTKEVGKGSGLGLAQVYGFVKQSGGQARIQSEVGQGTTVELLLPRSHGTPAEQDSLSGLQGAVSVERSTGHVLLVEDDNEVAALVTEMLAELGYEVTRTASAAAALGALANGRQVDVVFSDIMMPGDMNGIDLVQELRRRYSDLPVLLTSGYSEASKREAINKCVGILPKPYRLDELATALIRARNPGRA